MQIFISLSIVSVLLALMLCLLIRKRFPDGTFNNLIYTMLAMIIWVLFDLLDDLIGNFDDKILFSKIFYIGVAFMPVFWFRFSFEFAKLHAKLNLKKLNLLAILPGITLILVFTNDFHGLIWQRIYSTKIDNIPIIQYEKGVWFPIHSIYSYLLLLAGMVLIIRYLIKEKKFIANLFILLAVIVPLIANSMYLFKITDFDYTSASFIFSCLCFTWSIMIESIENANLMQLQIIQNEKMAGIGQLSAGIAHEINNPLGFIISNVDMLNKYLKKIHELYLKGNIFISSIETDDPKLLEQLAEINKIVEKNKIKMVFDNLEELTSDTINGLQRIEKIVKSLLGFARNISVAEFGEFDLNCGIKETLTIVNNEIKNYSIIKEEFSEVPSIYACAGEINQVILNLLINAIYAIKSKQNPQEPGCIIIKTYQIDALVCCEIRDNGIGINAESISKIYDPFFTTKPVGEGTGIGLSIAHDIIVNKHNGQIKVQSTLGIGTTFTIKLPITRKN